MVELQLAAADEDVDGVVAAADVEADTAPVCATWPVLRFDIPPRRIYHFRRQFQTKTSGGGGGGGGIQDTNNFLKGLKWSPDGSCFLSCSDDNTLRIFALPVDVYNNYLAVPEAGLEDEDSYSSGLTVKEGESIYDFCWYPYMSASDPATCVFASTTRDHPIHLWDAYTGQLRCTYRAYDAMDEITAALSVAFNSSGTKLFAGYNKSFRVFDVHRPGREFAQHPTMKGNEGFSGIVSSIAFSPASTKMFAMGSYCQTTAIFAEDTMELLYLLHGQTGGVTQVLFSRDGNYLYTGGRKDPYIYCWDIRNTAGILYKLYRSSGSTNQRLMFDIDASGGHLGTGGEDGLVHIYSLENGHWITSYQAASDTVTAFTFHPSLPLAASSSGHRRFNMTEDHEETLSLGGSENCASVWSFYCYTDSDMAYEGSKDTSCSDIHSNTEVISPI